MNFNLNVTILEYVEECTHGVIAYEEVSLKCCRSTDEVVISQNLDTIMMSEDQAKQLYLHLKSVFE